MRCIYLKDDIFQTGVLGSGLTYLLVTDNDFDTAVCVSGTEIIEELRTFYKKTPFNLYRLDSHNYAGYRIETLPAISLMKVFDNLRIKNNVIWFEGYSEKFIYPPHRDTVTDEYCYYLKKPHMFNASDECSFFILDGRAFPYNITTFFVTSGGLQTIISFGLCEIKILSVDDVDSEPFCIEIENDNITLYLDYTFKWGHYKGNKSKLRLGVLKQQDDGTIFTAQSGEIFSLTSFSAQNLDAELQLYDFFS